MIACDRKLSEERASAEEHAAEVEKKLSDLISRINNMIRVDVADAPAAYSAEQTLNAVSLFTLCTEIAFYERLVIPLTKPFSYIKE